MKKILFGSLFITFLLSVTIAFAATDKSEHFRLYFNSGDAYEATLKDHTLTWKGIAGTDKGEERVNQVKRLSASKNLEVFQWTEKTGSFVTLIFDRKHHKAVCSGRMKDNSDWLWLGKVIYE